MREPDARKAAHFSALPEEWKIVPLLYATKYTTGFTPPSGNDKYYGGDYPWVNISDLDGRRVLSDTQRSLSTDAIERFPEKHPAPKGSLLFSFKLSLGNVAIAGRDLFTNEAIAAFIPNKELSIDYAYYCFPVFLPLYSQTNIYGAELLGASRFERTKIPLPPIETQRRIADYLDRETAKIDTAVADLDRYSDLLAKRRLLVVDEELSHHQTPETDEQLTPLKFIIETRFSGDWGSEPRSGEIDARCVRVADFDRATNTVNDEVPTVRSYSSDIYASKRLRYHDILVERSGGGDKTPVGSAMLYTGGNEALCANFIEVVRLKDNQVPEYWAHILRREYAGRNTMRFVKQTTGIQNLDPQGFYDQKFHVPRKADQQHLARVLRHRTSAIDNLIAESTRLRDLLLKRRSVLITEVVTGRKQV